MMYIINKSHKGKYDFVPSSIPTSGIEGVPHNGKEKEKDLEVLFRESVPPEGPGITCLVTSSDPPCSADRGSRHHPPPSRFLTQKPHLHLRPRRSWSCWILCFHPPFLGALVSPPHRASSLC